MNGTGRGRGRGGRGRGRGRGRARGRGKKVARVESSDEECAQDQSNGDQSTDEPPPPPELAIIAEDVSNATIASATDLTSTDAVVKETDDSVKENEPEGITGPPPIDMEADISQLEAPTFTTISRGPPEPMLRLKWDHKVSLIGEKVLNPMIHCCDQCLKPILIYGRMIPCKHVFCLKCARTEPVKVCPRCKEKVCRVEQSALGSVFMCSHGGTRYGNTGCRRTYLSQRDLQAHINHRHMENSPKPPPPVPPIEITGKPNMISNIVINQRKPLEPAPQSSVINPRQSNTNNPTVGGNNRMNNATANAGVVFPPTSNSTRANLITVPIQDSQQNIPQVIGMGGQQQAQPISDLPGNYYGSSSQSHPYSTSSGFQSNQQFAIIPTIPQSKSIPPTQQIHNLSLSRTSSNSGTQPNQPYYNQPHYAPPQYGQMQQHYQSSGRQSYDGPNYNPGNNPSITNPSTLGQSNVSHNNWNQQQYYR